MVYDRITRLPDHHSYNKLLRTATQSMNQSITRGERSQRIVEMPSWVDHVIFYPDLHGDALFLEHLWAWRPEQLNGFTVREAWDYTRQRNRRRQQLRDELMGSNKDLSFEEATNKAAKMEGAEVEQELNNHLGLVRPPTIALVNAGDEYHSVDVERWDDAIRQFAETRDWKSYEPIVAESLAVRREHLERMLEPGADGLLQVIIGNHIVNSPKDISKAYSEHTFDKLEEELGESLPPHLRREGDDRYFDRALTALMSIDTFEEEQHFQTVQPLVVTWSPEGADEPFMLSHAAPKRAYTRDEINEGSEEVMIDFTSNRMLPHDSELSGWYHHYFQEEYPGQQQEVIVQQLENLGLNPRSGIALVGHTKISNKWLRFADGYVQYTDTDPTIPSASILSQDGAMTTLQIPVPTGTLAMYSPSTPREELLEKSVGWFETSQKVFDDGLQDAENQHDPATSLPQQSNESSRSTRYTHYRPTNTELAHQARFESSPAHPPAVVASQVNLDLTSPTFTLYAKQHAKASRQTSRQARRFVKALGSAISALDRYLDELQSLRDEVDNQHHGEWTDKLYRKLDSLVADEVYQFQEDDILDEQIETITAVRQAIAIPHGAFLEIDRDAKQWANHEILMADVSSALVSLMGGFAVSSLMGATGDWPFIIGLVATAVAGFSVDKFLRFRNQGSPLTDSLTDHLEQLVTAFRGNKDYYTAISARGAADTINKIDLDQFVRAQ